MTLDWTHFTPWTALSGGLLLGLASALFVLLNGRILGISGIVGGLLTLKPGETVWRLAFLLGLFAAPATLAWFAPAGLVPVPRIETGTVGIVIAGLLVGFGTRLGSGCTSGHGVCGLSRLSPRSLVATLSFMGAGFAIVYVLRHVV
jgi:uncharacterized membrane protein YedE/YeeE